MLYCRVCGITILSNQGKDLVTQSWVHQGQKVFLRSGLLHLAHRSLWLSRIAPRLSFFFMGFLFVHLFFEVLFIWVFCLFCCCCFLHHSFKDKKVFGIRENLLPELCACKLDMLRNISITHNLFFFYLKCIVCLFWDYFLEIWVPKNGV